MAKESDLSTDWQRSAGSFSCIVCKRQRLPASEFSKKQVEKALESLNSIPDKDVRTGPEITSTSYVSAVCKKCTEEKEAQERADAAARRTTRDEAAAEAGPLEEPERAAVTLGDRPFGMTPSKADGAGYLVVKVSEGKPAAKAGVRPGWRLASIEGEPVGDRDLEALQAALKEAKLPVAVEFDKVPGNADFCTACQQILAVPLFSRKMRTKPPEKRRCSSCVEAAEGNEAGEEGGADGESAGQDGKGKQSKLSELQALCAETAAQGEQVTGIKAVRGGSFAGRGGKARGRGYR
eukprot:gnl/TRDRNA2_/TRDRNA2_201659_c0_seq1.p1 gnl/TRDRNA2_/TRDRNA2_201659_c0~~gnl/TRDRNA2_/TRDRNA2_201659_c0_seq1.p1  ORF type:complete len:293 (-),score=73.62 gnl/TRDRNA2_/TRDRNA2_201659_c0_seq1:63-941(-)